MEERALSEGRTRVTLQEVRQRIAEGIHRGERRLGDRLPAERTLAAQLGVSRMTVRKAYRELIDAGVLEVRSGAGSLSGAFVRSELVPRSMLKDPTSLPLGEIAGVLETRRLFEPRVAQLAAQRATKNDLAELRRTIALQRSLVHDPQQVSLLDPTFHVGMARATHNETIVAMMEVLHERLRLLRRTDFRPKIAIEAIDHHQRTLDAIAGGDEAEIEAVMDVHLGLMEQAWIDQEASARGGAVHADDRTPPPRS